MGNKLTGDTGEDAAAEFLAAAGYIILARKYRVKPGEIDIVANQGSRLVFIEVKTRRDNAFGSPAEAVTPAKQRKIVSAAWCYLKQHGKLEADCRFDVMEVWLSQGGPARFNHITDAFGL